MLVIECDMLGVVYCRGCGRPICIDIIIANYKESLVVKEILIPGLVVPSKAAYPIAEPG